jgi:branched-chain amino acid transport system substrate-binding protein
MTRAFLTLALIVSIFSSFSCVQKGGDQTATNTGDTIKVGVYGDLTGQTSSFGQSTKNGIELAVEEINNAGGINGKKIQLIVEDDQGRPEQAKTVVSKLINQDKVQAVLGEVASTNRGRRLHFARVLHRSVPGFGDGEIRGEHFESEDGRDPR